jgi:hypothetical protein
MPNSTCAKHSELLQVFVPGTSRGTMSIDHTLIQYNTVERASWYLLGMISQSGVGVSIDRCLQYHSHLSSQYVDGLRGPFVVYDPQDPHL